MSNEALSTDLTPEALAEILRAQEAARAEKEAAARAEEEARLAEEAIRVAEQRATTEAQTMAALQDLAEAENAERDALAASLAVIAAQNAAATPQPPLPVPDVVNAPEGGFGPSLASELTAAGVDTFPFFREVGRIVFNHDIPAEQRAAVMAVVLAHDPTKVVGPDLAAYAKTRRDDKENGGITVQGVPIATDDRSKVLVAGARMRADDNPEGFEAFAAADGREYELPAAVIVSISKALGEHVSRCFKAFAEVKARLAADPPTITTEAEIDAAFQAVSTAY